MISLSQRLLDLPPYIFSEISQIRAEAEKKGVSLLSLAIGDPDQPTPPEIIEKIQAAASNPVNHAYSSYEGMQGLREAISRWMERRFGVSVSADSETLALIGSKEGIAHFPLAFCNPGDRVLYPDPGYPIFQNSILLAGGTAVPLPHRAEDRFLPNLSEMDALLKQHRPKFMILNYPSNPTSAVCPIEVLTEIVRLARKYETAIAYDNAYCELYFDDAKKPPSILQIPGAKEIAIEFHSFSKTFNMTGWRLAFAVGNESLVKGLLKVKTNIDSGPLLAVQQAGIFALDNSETLTQPLRELYAGRRQTALKYLDRLGIEYFKPEATFFLWARVPAGLKSMELTKRLIQEQGLVVTPGIGFGTMGENFFRLALTVDESALGNAFSKLEAFLR